MTTEQSYKQIWLTLIVDKEISIKIEDPKTMKERDNSSLFSQGHVDQLQNPGKPADAPTQVFTTGNAVAPEPLQHGDDDPNETNRKLLQNNEEGKQSEQQPEATPAPE